MINPCAFAKNPQRDQNAGHDWMRLPLDTKAGDGMVLVHIQFFLLRQDNRTMPIVLYYSYHHLIVLSHHTAQQPCRILFGQEHNGMCIGRLIVSDVVPRLSKQQKKLGSLCET